MAVISVEPIYECLALHKLLPECQKAGWYDFWNTENWDFVVETPDGPGAFELKADVSLYDDGKKVYVGLYCREPTAMHRCLEAVARVAAEEQKVRDPDERYARPHHFRGQPRRCDSACARGRRCSVRFTGDFWVQAGRAALESKITVGIDLLIDRRACPLVGFTVMMVGGSLFNFNRISADSGPSKQCPALRRRTATLAPPYLAFVIVRL